MRIPRSSTLILPATAILFSWAAAGQTTTSPSDAKPLARSTIATAEGTPQRQAAEDGLRTLTTRLISTADTPNANRIMAVDDYRALRDASIGSGFEVNLIDPNALLAGKSIDASTYRSGVWRFVVMLDNKPVGLITVARMQGQWKMVEAGASELAQEIMAVVTAYASRFPLAQLRFIRSRQGMADLIEVIPTTSADQTGTPLYIPLLSARVSLNHGTDPSHAASLSAPALDEAQIASALRASVRRGMRDPRFLH